VVTLVGLVGQLYRPASATLLTELTPQHQQVMVFALYRWALNLGTTVAPLLGALLISMSFQLLFWSEAATAAAFAVIAAVALPRRVPVASTQAPTRSARGGYRAVFGDRRYLRFLLATALNSLVYIQYVSTLPLAMRDAGLATIWFSCVIALNGFIVISCELLVTKLTQRWPVRRVIAAGFLLLGIGFSFYALPLGLAAFVLGTLVWTSAEIVAGPTMFAYPGRVAPDQLRGRYVAAMQTMFSLGSVAGPALGVVLYRAIGAGFWLCCGATCLVGLVLAASAIGRPDQQVQEVQEVQEAQEVQVTA
jgi:predicted MFS family arabinose efflux permease